MFEIICEWKNLHRMRGRRCTFNPTDLLSAKNRLCMEKKWHFIYYSGSM